MKMKNILSKSLIAIFLAGSITSCESYLDINESPTDPILETVNPDLLLGGALTSPYEGNFSNTANALGNLMMANWGGDVNNITGAYLDEYQLNITTTFYSGVWDDTYLDLSTSQAIIDKTTENYDYHKAIALINRTFYFQYLVDLYGDIPYTEALKFDTNYAPTYDDDQQIYRSLIEDLDMALAMITNADSADIAVGSEDVVFGGDMQSWVQFANTLKLRILIRQSVLAESDGETASYLNEQFGSLSQNFLTNDATINPGYSNTAAKQNPFYAVYGFTPTGEPGTRRNVTTPADYAAEFMKGFQPNNPNVTENIATGVFDPRVEQIYEPLSSGEVVGVVQGEDNTTAPEELSKLGPSVVRGADQDGYLFTAAESYFLQAEAVERGYISGNAKSLFQQGIRKSFELHNIGGQADTYISNSNNTNLIGWDGSTNKIEAIMTQKWIALNTINGVESWIEYNRTGFPDVPLSTVAQEPAKPNRLLYPASEYSANSANVPQQSQTDAFNTSVFWDVN